MNPLEAVKELKQVCENHMGNMVYILQEDKFGIIETALKDYQELLKIDCKQNTINDFYPNTMVMIDDLLNLVCTKVADFLKEGKRYTRTAVLETLGFAIRYVKTFAYGQEFNETENISVREKKIKALEIIKGKKVDMTTLHICFEKYDLKIYNKNVISENGEKPLTQKEYNLLKEVLINE